MSDNIFELGTLCILSTKMWTASKKIPLDKVKRYGGLELQKWVRANKGLIDREALSDIGSIISKTRMLVKSLSLPFPVESVSFVPKDLVPTLAEKLEEKIKLLEDAIEILANNYNKFIDEAKEILEPEGLFDINDYPKNIKEKFDISYKFMEMSVPGKMSSISPKLYEQELIKFQNMVEETRNEGILFLREGFLKTVQAISKSLTEKEEGETKRFRKATVEKIENFFEEFKSKNIFKDNELARIIESARDTMFGINIDDLKNSEGLRKHILKEMDGVEKMLEGSIQKYRRKITL